jgi:two-component system phosphate regulon response regulator PhoB
VKSFRGRVITVHGIGPRLLRKTQEEKMKPLILLVSEDPELCLLLQHILEAEGYAVCHAGGSDDVTHLATLQRPHAILLDCAPNSVSPMKICEKIRLAPDTRTIPIGALIGPNNGDQHISLLKAGIDEGMIRPLVPARMLSFLQRDSARASKSNELGSLMPGKSLCRHNIEMDIETYRIYCNGHHLDLPPIGFRILQHFLRYPGRIHSRNELIATAWRKPESVCPRTVDVHIGRLRKCLNSLIGAEVIRTVRAAGYTLDQRIKVGQDKERVSHWKWIGVELPGNRKPVESGNC